MPHEKSSNLNYGLKIRHFIVYTKVLHYATLSNMSKKITRIGLYREYKALCSSRKVIMKKKWRTPGSTKEWLIAHCKIVEKLPVGGSKKSSEAETPKPKKPKAKKAKKPKAKAKKSWWEGKYSKEVLKDDPTLSEFERWSRAVDRRLAAIDPEDKKAEKAFMDKLLADGARERARESRKVREEWARKERAREEWARKEKERKERADQKEWEERFKRWDQEDREQGEESEEEEEEQKEQKWGFYYGADADLRTLGVALSNRNNASVIRKAFRKLALKHHPDKGGDPAAFRKIREAYERLAN
jgi:hypothetical protein